MTASDLDFYPRSIALARTQRAARLGYYVGAGAAALIRGLSALAARVVAAEKRRRDLALLLEMDPRLLHDIGLSRGEVLAAARGQNGLLDAAAQRREAAMDAVHKVRTLPRHPASARDHAEISVRSPRRAA